MADMITTLLNTTDFGPQINPTIASAVSSGLPAVIDQTLTALPTEEEAYQIGRRIGEELMKEARAKVPLLGNSSGATLQVDSTTYNKIMDKLPPEIKTVIGKTTLIIPLRGPIKVVLTQERLNKEIQKSVDPILRGIVDVVAEQTKAPIQKAKYTIAAISAATFLIGGAIGFFWAKNKYQS